MLGRDPRPTQLPVLPDFGNDLGVPGLLECGAGHGAGSQSSPLPIQGLPKVRLSPPEEDIWHGTQHPSLLTLPFPTYPSPRTHQTS